MHARNLFLCSVFEAVFGDSAGPCLDIRVWSVAVFVLESEKATMIGFAEDREIAHREYF